MGRRQDLWKQKQEECLSLDCRLEHDSHFLHWGDDVGGDDEDSGTNVEEAGLALDDVLVEKLDHLFGNFPIPSSSENK